MIFIECIRVLCVSLSNVHRFKITSTQIASNAKSYRSVAVDAKDASDHVDITDKGRSLGDPVMYVTVHFNIRTGECRDSHVSLSLIRNPKGSQSKKSI